MPIANDPLVQRAVSQPYDLNTTRCSLALTTSDNSVDLPGDVYELTHDGAAAVSVRIGGAVEVPAPGDPAVAGFVIPPGGLAPVVLPAGTTALHALIESGTATLHIVRKVLS